MNRLTTQVAFGWLLFLAAGVFSFIFSDSFLNTFYDILGYGQSQSDSVWAHLISILGIYFGGVGFNRYERGNLSLLKNLVGRFDVRMIFILAFGALLSAVVSTLIAYGYDGLFFRTNYLAEQSAVGNIAQITTIAGCFFCSLLCSNRSRVISILGFLMGMVFVLLAFAKGSRYAAFGLLLITVVPSLFVPAKTYVGKIIRLCKVGAYLFAVVLALHAILYFRSFDTYGLSEYWKLLPAAIEAAFAGGAESLESLVSNIGFSVPVTQATINLANTSPNDLYIAFTPLSGEASGWTASSTYRRVSADIPFSSFGELYSYSPILLFSYMFIAGLIISGTEYFGRRLPSQLSGAYSLILLSLTLSFFLLAAQYNLRSITRLLYYNIFFFIGFFILGMLSSSKRSLVFNKI